ncbi:MAG: hypothetical protein MUC43_01550 [Pirellula sp.]|jgi:hypothetical protein|nr:hypothetical protein [Pirellula sp.]
MALRDLRLVDWLTNENVMVRTAALEMLSNGYSTDQRVCEAVFSAWDQFTTQDAFPEFPMITHLEIPKEFMSETLSRAEVMSAGRPLTDRACRCAGKLLEAVSVSSPLIFSDHIEQIAQLKEKSKIFFRIDLDRLRFRVSLLDSLNEDSVADWFTSDIQPMVSFGYYPHLESLYLKGRAEQSLQIAFEQLRSGERKPHVLETGLELASRYRLVGYESVFADGIDDENSSVADGCAIALSRCRNDNVLSLIAERFADYSRSGQLRSIDVLRRSRLPKTSELLRFLRAHAQGSQVQNALRIAEVLQFDFSDLENWLEAILVVDDASLKRIASLLCLVGPLSEGLSDDDKRRMLHLVRSRLQDQAV